MILPNCCVLSPAYTLWSGQVRPLRDLLLGVYPLPTLPNPLQPKSGHNLVWNVGAALLVYLVKLLVECSQVKSTHTYPVDPQLLLSSVLDFGQCRLEELPAGVPMGGK